MTKAKTKPAAAGLSLVDYVKAKRRESCVVCSLPDDIRGQLRNARKQKTPREIILDWLEKVLKSKITSADLTGHVNGHHEDR